MYACRNCGSDLRYDIASHHLVCDYCDSTFPVKDMPDMSYRKKEYESNVFECPQCGAQIVTQSNDLTGRCSYCGCKQVFKTRVESITRPAWIIPFNYDKDTCKSIYKHAVKKAIFAPGAIKKTEYIDGIRGIYMPYWFYNNEYHKTLSLSGQKKNEKVQYSGNTSTVKIYNIQAEYNAQHLALQKDGSTWYSDEISDNIQPFYLSRYESGLQPFNPAYMCGFYGEMTDVPAPRPHSYEAVEKRIAEEARGYVYQKSSEKYLPERGFDPLNKPSRSGPELGYLPVWFLSYGKGKRVTYAAINGQTGQLSATFPIDLKKFLASALAISVLLYLILNLFWVMRPEYIALAAAIGASWAVRFFRQDIREIARKEYAMAPPDQRKYGSLLNSEKFPFKKKGLIPYLAVVLLIILENTGYIDRHPNGLMVWLPAALTLWAAIRSSIDIFRHIPDSKNVLKSVHAHVWPAYLPAYLSILAALVVEIIRPANDYIYFGIAFGCMAMTLISLLSVVLCYNRMSTRRMPQFDHLGGDDRAKTS